MIVKTFDHSKLAEECLTTTSSKWTNLETSYGPRGGKESPRLQRHNTGAREHAPKACTAGAPLAQLEEVQGARRDSIKGTVLVISNRG